jgi:hypothetical protein
VEEQVSKKDLGSDSAVSMRLPHLDIRPGVVLSDLVKERSENVATALANDSTGFTGHCPRF